MIQAESLPLSLPPSPLRSSAPIKRGKPNISTILPPPLSTLSCLSRLPTRHSSQKASPRGIIGLWVSFLPPTFMTNTPKKTPHATYNPWPPPPAAISVNHQDCPPKNNKSFVRLLATKKRNARGKPDTEPARKNPAESLQSLPLSKRLEVRELGICQQDPNPDASPFQYVKTQPARKPPRRRKKCWISHVLILKAKKKTPMAPNTREI